MIHIVSLQILIIDVEFVRIYYSYATSSKKMAPLIGNLSFWLISSYILIREKKYLFSFEQSELENSREYTQPAFTCSGFQPLIISSESSILDICQDSEYASYFNGQYILVRKPRRKLHVQSQQQKLYNKVWNMFKVINKDLKKLLLLTLNTILDVCQGSEYAT